jgi:3,4-dihydroxy 2-butanone 4-phosphate synthase/GTP cyclohydrolase II
MESNFQDALDRYKSGEMIIVIDDHDRENEGDLIMLAEHATPEKTAFMVRHTTGILCVAITADHAFKLRLPYMVEQNQDQRKTAFTVSVDLAKGITTGVSAVERSATIRALGSSSSVATDFIRPGHIFPLIANKGGVQTRGGHTEAGVALAQLTGSFPAALLSEIVAEDGSMARGETLSIFAKENNLPIISIAEIKEYQLSHLRHSQEISYPNHHFEWVDIQLENGEWNLATYPSLKHREQVVMRFGSGDGAPLIRIHSECFTGDVIHSQRCDCGEQLTRSLSEIEAYGYGYILYLRDHEGRGIGLTEKLKAYLLQNEGVDTVDANLKLGHSVDSRDWSEAIAILKNLNLSAIKLLTNNPEKVRVVIESGITCDQIPLMIEPNKFNIRYLTTKADRLGHKVPLSKGEK